MDNEEYKDEKLEKILENAMNMSDVIAYKEILEANNITYDENIDSLDELRENIEKNYSESIREKADKKFDTYKQQSADLLKNFDANNMSIYKAEHMIKNITSIVSPIAQTMAKSALTIAIYQGLYLLPLPLKLGIAGTTFAVKRLPKILKGSKEALQSLKKDGIGKCSKKVVATLLAGGAGIGSISLLNYLAKGAIPDKILNLLPGIKDCLKLVPQVGLKKAVLWTTGLVKGIDTYRLKKDQNKESFDPIIRGFFKAKNIEIDDEKIESFKDVEKYVNMLDDEGKYQFNQYVKKCTSLNNMAHNSDNAIKKIGKRILNFVSDSFEMASYLALITPPNLKIESNDSQNQPEPKPEPEPVTEHVTENNDIKINNSEPIYQPTLAPIPTPEDCPEISITPNDVADTSEKFIEVSPSKVDDVLDYCSEHKDTITIGSVLAMLGVGIKTLLEIAPELVPMLL